LAIIAVVMSVDVAFAQDATSEKSVTLSGDIRTGSGYAPLFGVKTSDEWSLFYSVDLQHKSDVGIAAFRMTDFRTEGLGKSAVFDLDGSGSESKQLSLYGAMEYGFMDNDNQMSFWCPYFILFWSNQIVNVNLAPMYCYYDQLKSDEVIIRLQASKQLFKGTELQVSTWYNNTLQKKIFGAVGITQQLPRNFYLQGDWLFREGKSFPMLNLGYKF
jgi:hypothetical protein